MPAKKKAKVTDIPDIPRFKFPATELFEKSNEQGGWSPIFEKGSSNDLGIGRIKVDRLEPDPGYVGEHEYGLSNRDLYVLYGPGTYELTPYDRRNKQVAATQMVKIAGDPEEWEIARERYKPAFLKRKHGGGADTTEIMKTFQELQATNQAAMGAMNRQIMELTERSSKESRNMMESFVQVQVDTNKQMTERQNLLAIQERDRAERELKRMKAEHEQAIERERERRRTEIEYERMRMEAERQRDRDFLAMMGSKQGNATDDMMRVVEVLGPLLKGPSAENDGSFWEKIAVEALPAVIEKIGSGQIQIPPDQMAKVAAMMGGAAPPMLPPGGPPPIRHQMPMQNSPPPPRPSPPVGVSPSPPPTPPTPPTPPAAKPFDPLGGVELREIKPVEDTPAVDES